MKYTRSIVYAVMLALTSAPSAAGFSGQSVPGRRCVPIVRKWIPLPGVPLGHDRHES